MKRTHTILMLATAVLLCEFGLAHAQTPRRMPRRPTNVRSTNVRPVAAQEDLFEVSAPRSSGRYFMQDDMTPPGAAIQGNQPPAPMMDGEPIGPGQLMGPEATWSEGPYIGGYDHGHSGCDCHGGCDSGYCGGGCGGTCGYFRWSDNMSVFSGVQGFRGPADAAQNANFGFNQGVNFAMPLFPEHCIGGQVGFRTTQTNLNGNVIAGPDANRDQAFITAGLFRRGGWLRGGAVVDILNDEYYSDFDLNQVRAELSMMLARGGEFGVWTAVSGDQDQAWVAAQNLNTVWSPVDQYAFFYRRELCNGGNYRMWGGFTGNSDTIFGSEILMPYSNRLALAANFNYLIPEEEGQLGLQQEAWNIGINLVWYPGGRVSCGDCGSSGLYDPLFRVADNGSFIVNRRNVQLVD